MQKIAFVTAASKGIGFSVARLLIAKGIRVLLFSSNIENLKTASEKLTKEFSVQVPYFVCNLREPSSVDECIHELNLEGYKPSILVNNCGGPPAGYYNDFTEAEWLNAYHEIFTSARKFTESFIPGMKDQGWGRIVNITSLAVREYTDNLILSTTFRNALTTYGNVLAKQVASFNITVNHVAPGYTATERLTHLFDLRAEKAGVTPDAFKKQFTDLIPMKRLAAPEEIAAAVGFLVSDDASYITGNTLLVDGGYSKTIS